MSFLSLFYPLRSSLALLSLPHFPHTLGSFPASSLITGFTPLDASCAPCLQCYTVLASARQPEALQSWLPFLQALQTDANFRRWLKSSDQVRYTSPSLPVRAPFKTLPWSGCKTHFSNRKPNRNIL